MSADSAPPDRQEVLNTVVLEHATDLCQTACTYTYEHKFVGIEAPTVLKLISLADCQSTFKDMEDELNSCKMFIHPNILLAEFAVQTDVLEEFAHFCMPFMSEGCLKRIISTRFSDGLQEFYVAPILKEILEGLSYLQEKSLFHGDIKPSNILVHLNGPTPTYISLDQSHASASSAEVPSVASVMLSDWKISMSYYKPLEKLLPTAP
ncbi:Protein kinase domain [Macleaya cordata]|uniref:Protein kinase domain n=1 Tax=Macleaya cordata TaxID=56857 RepID=A0A200PNC2_MACCD|nr:Protein kinase domain [Macleaya cordata]